MVFEIVGERVGIAVSAPRANGHNQCSVYADDCSTASYIDPAESAFYFDLCECVAASRDREAASTDMGIATERGARRLACPRWQAVFVDSDIGHLDCRN